MIPIVCSSFCPPDTWAPMKEWSQHMGGGARKQAMAFWPSLGMEVCGLECVADMVTRRDFKVSPQSGV